MADPIKRSAIAPVRLTTDYVADHLALTMAGRTYYCGKGDAYDTYWLYYGALTGNKPIATSNPDERATEMLRQSAVLKTRIKKLSLKEQCFLDVTQSEESGFVSIHISAEALQNNHANACELAFRFYQHHLRALQTGYAKADDTDAATLAKMTEIERLRYKHELETQHHQRAAELAFEVYCEYFRTLHGDYSFHKPQISRAEFSDEMAKKHKLRPLLKRKASEDFLLPEDPLTPKSANKTSSLVSRDAWRQAVASAWNTGYKMGTMIAVAAYYAKCVYHRIRTKKSWKQIIKEHEHTESHWVKKTATYVGRVLAGITLTVLVLPALLIHHKTRRPSLQSDDITKKLYATFDRTTDHSGHITDEYRDLVQQFIDNIIANYHSNRMKQSSSSRRLMKKLKLSNKAFPLEEKLQLVMGYMTTTHTDAAPITTAKQILFSRDKAVDFETNGPFNNGKRLFCVIEQQLVTLERHSKEIAGTLTTADYVDDPRFAPSIVRV